MNNHLNSTESSSLTEALFSERIRSVPRSFIREILKVAVSPDVISFAGGLPNPELFPVEALKYAAVNVLENTGKSALQYSNSEGYLPLREYIADRYKHDGIDVSPNNILITSGSQQGLDLLGKIFIDPGDEIIIEEPGYLGAIQAFSLFQAQFIPVPLQEEGMSVEVLKDKLARHNPKLMYVVPDFQNPSGISYSENVRNEIAGEIENKPMIIVEDTPYTAIRFDGKGEAGFYRHNPDKTVLLGTFSKTAVPGFRIGWMVAPDWIMAKLITAKQAADLHTNIFTQQVLYEYLIKNDIDQHIELIRSVYGKQCRAMLDAIENKFPHEIRYTKPEGGMFLWLTLPEDKDAMQLFEKAIERKVAFVPGNPFYVHRKGICNTLRLNFSCSDEERINEGIDRLAEAYQKI